jgi:hypothetical protein
MTSRRTFVPGLEALEDRCMPAPMMFNGGFAEQTGSVLNVNVMNPADTVFIIEDGSGDVWVQWNGWLPNGASGITNIQVNGMGSSNTVFFLDLGNLNGQLSLNLMGINNTVIAHLPMGSAPITYQSNSPVQTVAF